jgi:hypothetical protein
LVIVLLFLFIGRTDEIMSAGSAPDKREGHRSVPGHIGIMSSKPKNRKLSQLWQDRLMRDGNALHGGSIKLRDYNQFQTPVSKPVPKPVPNPVLRHCLFQE